ncbi:MAG: hypothetical protein J6Y47_09560 [Bacteroidales bacterium]|nr:hypothetical protein [Bacteroidales bacterium]
MRKIFHTGNLTILVMVLGVLVLNSCKKEYTITVKSNNEAWGSVTGSGTYTKGKVISIEAIAKNNYRFLSWQDGSTDNPRSITVRSDAMYIAKFVKIGGGGEQPTDMGIFSVSSTRKVHFSPGNLQWSATNGGNTPTTHIVAGNGTADGTWRFAPNQWDMIGINNSNVSSTYTGWIDLFGWCTSGYNNKYPYMTSTIHTDYGNGSNNAVGTNYDWGVYNAIYNPKTQKTDAPSTWRTLTNEEWEYLINTRPTSSSVRYAKATVHGIVGLIIVPDDYNSTLYPLNSVNTESAAYTSNIIDASDWSKMENIGCVFLPAAGSRDETTVNDVASYGNYWSITYYTIEGAHYLNFNIGNLYPSGFYYTRNRIYGHSVRLVKDVQ